MDKKPFHIVSPLLESLSLSRAGGTRVYMKLENVQPAGSFKIRGIGHLCQEAARRGCRGFVCSSGGNAGLAAAYAAKKLGLPITVVVPSTTGPGTVRKLEELGAKVEVSGQVWDEANRRALELAEAEGWVSIHPFDHPLVCVAKCLGAKTVAARALECAQECQVISQVVEDTEAVRAVEQFLDDERMLVQPACGAALALLYTGRLQRLQHERRLQPPLGSMVVVVCGGASIQVAQLWALKNQLGLE
nr:serine dehydratase-like isoform X1 [Columba livia]XP_021140139.1 serine dehydratase-like isoform X1 [Columba livia]XP_021140140.1 serine dehydratase-like isoform X1 [Columba livia]XP_021140141.1 serine dehydratase-like isoform X1 [Columba livia]